MAQFLHCTDKSGSDPVFLYRVENGQFYKILDLIFFNFLKRFYLFIHERHKEREVETGRGRRVGEAGSMQGARRGT